VNIPQNNIILAGVARSGSTLTCYLLNKTTDTVALHEPINPAQVPIESDKQTISFISDFFNNQRKQILSDGSATSKSSKGSVPDNPLGGVNKITGKRIKNLDGNRITINKELTSDFLLVIKQPGLFTGRLELLTKYFPCFATIRNPLGVLRSWNTVDMPVSNGHAPAAEQCDPILKGTLANEADVSNRQLILLSWYFEQFYKHLPADNVIRYESVIDSEGKSLSKLTPSAKNLNEKLQNKNNNPIYDDKIKKELTEKLLDSDGYYWKYYSKDDVYKL